MSEQKPNTTDTPRRPKWNDFHAAIDRDVNVLRREVEILRRSNAELRLIVNALEERVSI